MKKIINSFVSFFTGNDNTTSIMTASEALEMVAPIPGAAVPLYTIRPMLAFQTPEQSRSIYSKLIKWWTRSNYIHVELVLNDSMWLSAVAGKGVRVKKLGPLKSNYTYVRLNSVTLTEEQLNSFSKWLAKQNGRRYDFWGIIFSQIFPFRLENPSEGFCSEVVTKALQMLTVPNTSCLQPNLITPGDLAKLYNLP